MGQDTSTEVAKPDDNRSAHGLARSGNPNAGSGPRQPAAVREEMVCNPGLELGEKEREGEGMRDGRIRSNCTGRTEVAADGGGVGGDIGISPLLRGRERPIFQMLRYLFMEHGIFLWTVLRGICK